MTLPTLRSTVTRDLDRVFDRLWSDWNLPLTVELPSAPGYKPEDIDVEVNGNVLTITGKFDATSKIDDAKYHRREIRRGAFERTVTLPQEIDPATKVKVTGA